MLVLIRGGGVSVWKYSRYESNASLRETTLRHHVLFYVSAPLFYVSVTVSRLLCLDLLDFPVVSDREVAL